MIASIVQLSQGIFLLFLRLSERMVRFYTLREFKAWFGIPHKKTKAQNLDSNYQMIQSQLTTELLYSILVAITKYGVGTVIEGKSHKDFREIDFTNTSNFKIDSMVVKNPDNLRVQDGDDVDLD